MQKGSVAAAMCVTVSAGLKAAISHYECISKRLVCQAILTFFWSIGNQENMPGD
jgi:hypothetical protein